MKTGAYALRTAKNMSGNAKHENESRLPQYRRKRRRVPFSCFELSKTLLKTLDPTPSVPPKTSQGAQNMKTGADALGTAENESGCANHENGT
jgi:hypothetical protein